MHFFHRFRGRGVGVDYCIEWCWLAVDFDSVPSTLISRRGGRDCARRGRYKGVLLSRLRGQLLFACDAGC